MAIQQVRRRVHTEENPSKAQGYPNIKKFAFNKIDFYLPKKVKVTSVMNPSIVYFHASSKVSLCSQTFLMKFGENYFQYCSLVLQYLKKAEGGSVPIAPHLLQLPRQMFQLS